MAGLKRIGLNQRWYWCVLITWVGAVGCAREPAPMLSLAGIPLVCSDGPAVGALAPEQIGAISAAAARICPKDRTVYFIFVRYNDVVKGHYRVVVYFSPDEQSPRVRKGSCVALDNDDEFPPSPGDFPALGKGRAPTLQSYIQISESARPFTRELLAPTVAGLPFEPPDGLREAEAVAVVDYLRSFGDRPLRPSIVTTGVDGSFTSALVSLPNRIDIKVPILRITVDGDEIRVMYGWVAGPLYGAGMFVTLRRTLHGYEVVSTSAWYS